MAGTDMIQRTSSSTMHVCDWSASSWRAWFRKNLSACANMVSALTVWPLVAASSVSEFRSWNQHKTKRTNFLGSSHLSKIGMSIFSSCPCKRVSRGVPLPSRLRGLGERRKLSRRAAEPRSPSRKRFWDVCVSFTILCNFTHLLVHLTAAWKWEIPTSLSWLVGLMFPFNFLGVSD